MKLTASHDQPHLQQHRGSPRRQQPPYLVKGSVAEVSSDEEGLKGAWYQATILNNISPFKKRNPYSGKVYVEYASLVSDKDRSTPLREYVSPEFIRPLPPVDTHPPGPFNKGDIVDAFYSDGWWTGVITDIVEGSKFKITFQNPPDAGEFSASDLRVHREWVNGSWIPPANQRAAGLMFSMGKRVEVSFDSGGPEDIWFPATVLEDKGNGLFAVEYHKYDGDGGSRNVKENVDSLHIRPCPPHVNEKTFSLLDKVDAFYDFGWWSGVITKVLAESRYKVFFKHINKEREFLFSELRPRMEWKGGKWFSSSQEVSIPSDYKIYDGFAGKNGSSVGVTVPLSSSMPTKNADGENTPFSCPSRMNKIELVTPSNDEPQVINSSPREMMLDSPYSGKKTLKGDAPAAVPSTETNASSYNAGEILSNVASAEKDAQPLGADKLNKSHSSQKNAKRKREKETAAVHSRKTPEKVQVKTSQSTMGGEEGNEADGVIEDVPRDFPVIETNLPVVLGLACVNSISSASKPSSRSNGEEATKCIGDGSSFGETVLHTVKVNEEIQGSNGTQKRGRGRPHGTQKRGRGRPRKHVEQPLITPMLDVEGATSLETSTPGQVIGTEGSGQMLVDDQINQENQSDIKNVTSPSIKVVDNAVENLVKHQYVRQPEKRNKKRMINLNLISNVHDVAAPTSGEGKTVEASCMTEEPERVVAESPNDIRENQPLSKWFGDLNSPAVDSSRCDKTSEEDMEIIKEDTAAAVGEIIPVVAAVKEPERLPFEKKSPIWSALESMQVLQNLPQKPHFQPLMNFKENVREGLAIGLMVTFTGVVDRASNMKYDDDAKASIDDILETLMDLETHGFDVGAVRERISGLERRKEKREKLEEEARKLKKEVEEKEGEKSRIEEEVEEMKKKMKELKEKRSKAMSTKETKEGEIESLHLKLMRVKEGMKNIRREFEGINNEGSSWLYGSS